MSQQFDTFTELRTVPRRLTGAIQLPDGQILKLVPDLGHWQRFNSSERLQGADVEAFTYVIHGAAIDPKQEAEAINNMATGDPAIQTIYRFGGYIVDTLHLETAKNDPATYEKAALMLHLLISYWQSRLPVQDAQKALPMLHRSYWRALDAIRRLTQLATNPPEQAMWRAWQLPYLEAREHWRAVCLDDAQTWFFDNLLEWEQERPPAQPSSASLARLWHRWAYGSDPGPLPKTAAGMREREMDALVWTAGSPPGWFRAHIAGLCPPGTDTQASRRWLQSLIESWYLPRYDLASARRLSYRIAKAERSWLGLIRLRMLTLGTARLFAGIGVGFLATTLQSDTWDLLAYLAGTRPLAGILLAGVLAIGGLSYLWQGIGQRIGMSGFGRALALWSWGQIFALILATCLFWVMRASPLYPDHTSQDLWGIPIIHAQIAIFIGIFTELLFGDKPATAPFDAP